MKTEADWERVVIGLEQMRGRASSANPYLLHSAIQRIRRMKCFPEAYVDGIADEMFQMLGKAPPRAATASVYLAFHGLEARASFVKVGVAVDVSKRMRALYTGNPLPRLWTFAANFASRSMAYRVESALHKHLQHDSTSGEWFKVHGLAEEAAAMFAQSLAEVASVEVEKPVDFAKAT